MSTVFGAFRKIQGMVVAAAALGALFVSQTQAHAGSVSPGGFPSVCESQPRLVACGGDGSPPA
jgi:hypothetical protein